MVNSRRGVSVQVYGQRFDATADGGVGAIVHDVDKGEIKAITMYGYGVLQPDFAAVDTSRITLLVSYLGNEELATGDMFVLEGNRYLSDGDRFSWLVFDTRGINHYEIPLKALPGE